MQRISTERFILPAILIKDNLDNLIGIGKDESVVKLNKILNGKMCSKYSEALQYCKSMLATKLNEDWVWNLICYITDKI